jgi:ribosomal-protein-alanine N-acetyltransferase
MSAPQRYVLETARLRLRRFDLADAPFIFELVNEPAFLRYIGDRGVRSLEDARQYLTSGPLAMYEKHGFGLFGVELKESGALVGMCGLLKRDALEDADVGFAFLSVHRGKGYGTESAAGVVAYAAREFGLQRLAAITDPSNEVSIHTLGKLGFRFQGTVELPGSGVSKLFIRDGAAS